MAYERLIGYIAELIEEHYFSADRAHEYADFLRFHSGKYAVANSDRQFSDLLNRDFFAMSNDLHLRLDVRTRSNREVSLPVAKCTFVERGIALIKLARFPAIRPDRGTTAQEIAEAFRLAASARSLIIDIRNNPGGDGASVALATSYLLDPPAIRLANYRGRTIHLSGDSWTREELPGGFANVSHPLADKPLCVLVNKKTFSAAEEFAYNLQQLGRATIIGETTRGGAHPSRRHPITDNLTLTVPFAETINPISNTNWEGVGVIPNVPCPSRSALKLALEHLRRDALRASLPT